jgi:hypothetical protein
MYGYSQPGNESDSALRLEIMVKKPKKSKLLTPQRRFMRQTLAENLSLLIEQDFPASRYQTRSDREQAVAKAAGCAWSTIQRILNQEVSTTTDMLTDLATVFHISPADLLTSNYAQLKRKVG